MARPAFFSTSGKPHVFLLSLGRNWYVGLFFYRRKPATLAPASMHDKGLQDFEWNAPAPLLHITMSTVLPMSTTAMPRTQSARGSQRLLPKCRRYPAFRIRVVENNPKQPVATVFPERDRPRFRPHSGPYTCIRWKGKSITQIHVRVATPLACCRDMRTA